jgi:hypothetical protein
VLNKQIVDSGHLLIGIFGSLQRDTLYFTFKSVEDLRRLVTQHLPKIVAELEVGLNELETTSIQQNRCVRRELISRWF